MSEDSFPVTKLIFFLSLISSKATLWGHKFKYKEIKYLIIS